MKIKKIFNGRALYTEQDCIWVARGMSFWAVDYDGKRVTPKYKVGTFLQQLLGINRLSRQLLREGLHHLLPLENGNKIVTAKKKTYIVNKDGRVINIFEGYRGNKPAHQGVCVTPDGTIFFGEYTLNTNREHDTCLYRSCDSGQSFECVLRFDKDDVRHIHFVKYDKYEKCLWLGTGDKDFECKLMRSDDNGDSWYVVGEGNQDWRAIGVCFREDSLFWGTDAGSVPDENHIIRMDRSTKQIEILDTAEGPCHGCAGFADGRIFISTGVEGGENETDRFARMKEINGKAVNNLFKMKKDVIPLILQYGVMRFPIGTENTDIVVFTAMGLVNGGEKVMVEVR
ncbi:MAG: hypothetical protein UIM24_03065 [Clostridia bacterium]|nr:hypothetical protein [Clostridia bacterium]